MRQLLTSLLILLSISTSSQNLVLNPSMEILTACPPDTGLVDGFIQSWGSYRGTPSAFTQCNGVLNNVPLNHFGNALPKDGGQYVGFAAGPNVFQYLGVELSRELSPDTTYTISFWYRLASNSTTTLNNGISAGFYNFPIGPSTVHPVPIPAVTVDSIASDGWQRYESGLRPFAKVRFMMIGAFKPASQIDYSPICPECAYKGSYVYIDAFCVSVNQDCTIPMSMSDRMKEPLSISQINGHLIRISKKVNELVRVFNVSGAFIKQSTEEIIDLSQYSNGMYILEVNGRRGKAIRY